MSHDPHAQRRRVQRALALLAIALSSTFGARASASSTDPRAPAGGRVIVLGFDGADARTIQALMDKGELPHLKALAERGTFAPLGTVNPAESPTAWASLNTGQNPAKTGVPGFVKRELPKPSGLPSPDFGFENPGQPTPIESFESTPIPTWSALKFGAISGAVVFALFFVLLALLLRIRTRVSVFLALALGAVGAWGGMALRRDLPSQMPKVTNPLAVPPFWELAGKIGKRCVVLDAAEAFDRPLSPNVKVLFGLGYPDARGDYMSYSIYTTDDLWFAQGPESSETDTGSGGNKFKVEERKGAIDAFVYGPPNAWEIDRLQHRIDAIDEELAKPTTGYKRSLELNTERKTLAGEGSDLGEIDTLRTTRMTVPLHVERQNGKALVTIGHETQELAEGAWSDWFHVTFDLNPILKIKAVTRAKLLHLDTPYFELYVDALQYDPAHPPFWQPLSQPEHFAAELVRETSTFETIGWACLTHPFKDGVLDPASFMQDIEFTETWREKLTYAELAKNDWDVFMSVMSTPDRVQHMMYQYYDPSHPLYDAAKAAQTINFYGQTIAYSDAIPATYRHLDQIVGKVVDQYLKPDDTLIVCGDHGFQSFRREVALNNWLYKNGFLAYRKGAFKRASDGGSFDRYVDWTNTKAYALGLGGVYVNLRGREGQGIVDPRDKDALLDEISAKFLQATDEKEPHARFGRAAYKSSVEHSGPYLDREPDLFLCFDAGWRVSWNTTQGGLSLVKNSEGVFEPGPVCSDNAKNWSGDHVSVDPSLVPCIFFCNRKVVVPKSGLSLLDIAPTVLALVGAPPSPDCDHSALTFQ